MTRRLAFAAMAAVLAWAAPAAALPTFAQVRADWRSADVVVLDRHGEPVGRVRDDFRARRGDWVALADTSPALRTAIVLSEDRRFYAHSGVDWQGVAAAAWANLWNTRTRGASTLTMQLAGLLDEDLRRPGAAGQGRSLTQKLGQAAGAAVLERSWSKDQILEAYLNLVPFRGELVGLSAMSQVLFGKYPEGLDARESALAVALVRAPNARAAQVASRACGILREMRLPRECDGLEGFAQLALLRTGPVAQRAAAAAPSAGMTQLAPHLSRHLVGEARAQLPAGAAMPARIASTLDARLQRTVVASLDRHLRELAGRNVEDGAVVVIDNASGDVLAYVGSSGALSGAAQVDHAAARRQAGSTLKPFLYAQALEEKRLTAASLLDDRPVNLPVGGGLYVPQNYDHRYAGWVSLRASLAASLNVPAVRTLVMVTPHRFHKRLVALGLPLTEAGDYYGYSLALGSADVSLLALTNAYRALANGGNYAPPRLRQGAPAVPATRVMQAGASYVVADILSDRHARARTFGLDSPLTTRFWTAVKTGTSKDMRDNWCIGWSQHYTVGVWVGNASGASMRDVSGVSGAAPVWHDVMEALHRARPSQAPAMPAGVERVALRFDDGLEPAREEVFLAGTAVRRVSVGAPAARAGTPMIATPADGTVFALDPDMPPASQRVWFQAQGVAGQPARAVSWRMDGKPLGRGGEVAWLPWPGRHQVELLDAAGKVVDRIGIEVRGASVRVPVAAARR
ncbi:penicillin-binding protein 1C [Cupriavidus taiwanensis]|uniref:peptidoglycan glycosyltransferase n=1 Tax=Cupriavidus taiwanensis TaxID=164546 RepID=A0A7Z7J724_9BURK|nr:penicillin-binding protein 1C [Cupriavidus taiwanensis]SOY84909.1 Penicillin-binding protein, transglycosylase and transpeptidase [Cupriavidus taiwanensis]SOZ00718.1 Penicillin-binding protein, transglycosylase and transpeptidase [Cupriavidus taiwanensis]SOZ02654.1 Penicillin-binding protein, transglycosylase and transpeptidase [Cupriavidus taiwanensis]SPC06039.1 Penicillin-binding protein, transglycosylase and transpeptidase [Cupriavidus taiwanensis]SPD42406.1 Penicillin-binding protein, t